MKKKSVIRAFVILIIVVAMSFSGYSFAADGQSMVMDFAWICNFIVNLMMWLWIPFASLAGELLTNTWVY